MAVETVGVVRKAEARAAVATAAEARAAVVEVVAEVARKEALKAEAAWVALMAE